MTKYVELSHAGTIDEKDIFDVLFQNSNESAADAKKTDEE